MATEKNILMKQFNGIDYDTLYPITKDTQVKMDQTTAENFFGSGTSKTSVEDALAALSKNYLYCWKKRSSVLEITEESYSTLYLYTGSSSASVSTIQYASGYTYDEPTNTWALKDVVGTIDVSASNYTSLNAAAGYYVKCNAVKIDTSVHKVTENPFVAKVTTAKGSDTSAAQSGSNYFITFSGDWVKENRVFGSWEYIYSSDPKAYPKNQIVDDVEYVYLGVPNNNALEGKKIFIGNYTGAGVKTLTLYFPFKPVIYGIIYYADNNDSSSTVHFVPWGLTPVTDTRGSTSVRTRWTAYYNGTYNYVALTLNDSYGIEFNIANTKYYYWGIG